ncbi:MAG: MerR family transcriptional regulator [Lachnospiraceae bacterium]|nr:MerR family transcriptional regulator [Lachnospiraceae bacterium]
MEYSIRELSELAGVSARTLRYYDQIGLLKPSRTNAAGYRFYGKSELELLQQILFYRERGLELDEIAATLYQKDFDVRLALQEHLLELEQQKQRMENLILNIRHTLASMKGEYEMKDKERFEGFKKNMIAENEKKYGTEIREKYGNETVDASNKRMMNMTEEQYETFTKLGTQIITELEAAVTAREPADGPAAQAIVQHHKEWLCMTSKNYTPEMHQGLGLMYVADQRFTDYYDKNVTGCAAFLSSAITHWAPLIP